MRTAWKYLDRISGIHRLLMVLLELAVFALAGLGAFLLRFDFSVPHEYLPHLLRAIVIWTIVRSGVFQLFKLDRGWWRYFSLHDIIRLGAGVIAGSIVSAGFILVTESGFPRSIYVIEMILCFVSAAGVRAAVRMAAETIMRQQQDGPEKRALIYGAGDAGIALLKELHTNPKLPYRVLGFLDDRSEKKGARMHGVPVLGSGDNAAEIVQELGIAEILIAVPSATRAEMSRIIEICHAAGAHCKTIPGMEEIIAGAGIAVGMRDVAVEDLLCRSTVNLDQASIRKYIEGKVVMVTGAAGSIGSELCRQIAQFKPAALVGFEIGETPLFHLSRQIHLRFPTVIFHSAIGSIQNPQRISEVLQQYSPSAIFHAAAYKHVPLMESHVFEAVENNVVGTYNVAAAALEHGVEKFVLISSDKAVRPTNIMGATKRFAELLLLAMECGRTKFVSVRFGNVLGSNGSVVPVFKEQIAAGGPVTVTHPEMRRYFMTIPEAAQLVLQASALGTGGEVFVLDMGEPVKIVDLARSLIRLSGLRPDEDIHIVFTGTRPGEKLYEELALSEENTIPTRHEKIRMLTGVGQPRAAVLQTLSTLRHACRTRDRNALVLSMKEIIPDYNPSLEVLRALSQESSLTARAASA